MRKATENQGNSRGLAANFSPRSKVKDPALQQRSLHQFTSFHQETPMKPSQVPNRLSHPPPRRVLQIQTPESCYRDKPGPHRHPPHHPGSIHSSVFSPSSPSNIGPSVHRPHPLSKHRLGPLKHSAQHPSSPANVGTALSRTPPMPRDMLGHPQQFAPPSAFYHASPQLVKNLGHYSPSSHIRRDEVTDAATSWNSGGKNVTAQRQETNKAESFGVGSSIQTVQLHSPPMSLMTTSFNTRAAQEVHPQPPSYSEYWSPHMNQWLLLACQPPPYPQFCDRSSGYTLPIMHSSVAPCQSQQHEPTPPSGNFIPAVDLNCLRFRKRHQEFESCLEDAKKLCSQGSNAGKTQTAKPTVGNSPVTCPVSLHSPAMELSPTTTERHLRTELACRPPSMGAKQAHIHSTNNHTVTLKELRSEPSESAKKQKDENCKRDKSRTFFSSEVSQSDTSTSILTQLSSHYSGQSAGSTSVLPVETMNRHQVGESRKLDSSTPKPALKSNSGSQSCRTVERNKTARARRTVVIPDDADKLFTPDPMIYIVNPAHKTAKPKINGETIKSSSSEKDSLSSTAANSSTPATGSSCQKTPNSKAPGSPHAASSSACNPPISLPTITLKRVKLENVISLCPEDKELSNSPVTSAGAQLKDKTVKSDDKHTSLLSSNLCSCNLETASAQTSKSSSPKSIPLERQASEGSRKPENEDPIDLDLDLDLSFALDVDLTQSSHSSEEEQLISLQEMMERVTKLPDTSQKGTFSEPSTPGHCSSQPKTQLLPSTTKSGFYKNNLDQMLKDINTKQKAEEIETQRITACKEDLLRIAEYEEGEETQEEDISTEQQKFLQHYTLMSSAIKEVAPGETVFNLDKFGQIFNQETLQLRQCMVIPQGTAQKTLLWSSPAQLRLHVNIGLFQEAYDCNSPCPTPVTCFLFKMMSVHRERMVSEKILQALCDIACTAAYQIVECGSQKFKVWVPSLADVTLVLMNMGVAFVTLFPFENLQPPFTEGDLLENIYIKSESPSSDKEQISFPEHNCNNILKYLSFCMGLCPRAYSDDELLLLLTVVGRVVLDTQLILQSSLDLNPLQYKIVNNIRSWDTMLPRICLALTDLTDDHHNMCLLVNLLPDNTRGKQLRRHLSLSMISKLLDGHCTYRATHKELQLSELRPYLPRMQPSTLLRDMLSSSSRSQKDKEDDTVTLDQQSYYLCYSLLTLTKEASNFQFFPAHQKEQLLILLKLLETHVKSDIRESEKCLYRSKVKDLVARIYTKWQMLLQKTRPLHNRLYDYWQHVDTLMSNQEEQEDEEEDEDEADVSKENDGEKVAELEEKEKEDKRVETHKDMNPDESREAMDSAGPTDEASDQ